MFYDLPTTLEVPTLSAQVILWELLKKARSFLDTHEECTYAFCNVVIPMTGGEVFAQVELDETTQEVGYIVGCDPVEGETYDIMDYSTALRALRILLSNDISF